MKQGIYRPNKVVGGASIRGADIAELRGRPSLKNPDYLVLEPRARFASEAIDAVRDSRPNVLDIGGRIQPYRQYFDDLFARYIGIDPRHEGMVDLVAVGEHLPFKDGVFDMVICTQVLSYSSDPAGFINEIYRVLKPGAVALLSAPSFFPMHTEERWRFLRDGLEHLLGEFSHVDVKAEGNSFAGLCRTFNVGINSHAHRYFSRYLLERLVYAPVNYLGRHLDGLSRGSERFTANYSALAVK